jgi:hypothetical protein
MPGGGVIGGAVSAAAVNHGPAPGHGFAEHSPADHGITGIDVCKDRTNTAEEA